MAASTCCAEDAEVSGLGMLFAKSRTAPLSIDSPPALTKLGLQKLGAKHISNKHATSKGPVDSRTGEGLRRVFLMQRMQSMQPHEPGMEEVGTGRSKGDAYVVSG